MCAVRTDADEVNRPTCGTTRADLLGLITASSPSLFPLSLSPIPSEGMPDSRVYETADGTV